MFYALIHRSWGRVCLLALATIVLAIGSCKETPVGPDSGIGGVRVASVEVQPAAGSVMVGHSLTFSATPRDAAGNPLFRRHVTWSVSSPSAGVDARGWVTGLAAGEATVTATCDGVTGIATIHIIDFPRPGRSQAVVLAAGDIASSVTSAEATAKLLDGVNGTILTLGDNAYPNGSAGDYAARFDPTWGRNKGRIRPCPGNHEYHTPGAPDYFAYFGASAGPPGVGYYSFDLGDWHIISLNSNIDMRAGSPQEQWLRADLAASTRQCTIAFWHHPRFSSGTHGNSPSTQPLWQALYDAGAEIVLVGHDHNYQRFAPQTPTGVADPARGIREFVVGTGGAGTYKFTTPIANTEAYDTNTHGVLQLTLGAGTYSWKFLPVAGQTYSDSGSGMCHR